jgi:hypothetical protein
MGITAAESIDRTHRDATEAGWVCASIRPGDRNLKLIMEEGRVYKNELGASR